MDQTKEFLSKAIYEIDRLRLIYPRMKTKDVLELLRKLEELIEEELPQVK